MKSVECNIFSCYVCNLRGHCTFKGISINIKSHSHTLHKNNALELLSIYSARNTKPTSKGFCEPEIEFKHINRIESTHFESSMSFVVKIIDVVKILFPPDT